MMLRKVNGRACPKCGCEDTERERGVKWGRPSEWLKCSHCGFLFDAPHEVAPPPMPEIKPKPAPVAAAVRQAAIEIKKKPSPPGAIQCFECPECGCNDAERAGRVSQWGKTWQRWRCTNCGAEYSAAPEERPADAEVEYVVLRCPNCQGDDVKTTSTVRPKRYHKCRTCGFTFRSIERNFPKSTPQYP